MSLPIVFRRQARHEFAKAADWYEQRRTGLGATLVRAVENLLREIAAHPARFAKVHKDVREGIVSGFPYCVYYREEANEIVVLSVFHTSRDPVIWQSRA